MKKYLLWFFCICILFNSCFASLFFSGVEFDEITDLNKFDNFNFNTTIVNSESSVFADVIFKYSIASTSSYEVYFKDSQKISMAPNEVKFFKESIDIKNIKNGQYWFNVLIYEQSGAPIAGMKYLIEFEGETNENMINILKGPYLIGLDSNGNQVQKSFGSLGNNMPQNSSKYLVLELENKNLEDIDILVELFNTYSIENKVYEIENKAKFNQSEIEKKILIDYNIPGTYVVRSSFFKDNMFLFSKDIRLVIAGISGSIVNVENEKDVYSIGENIKLSGVLIGPADGVTKLENVDLELLIYQDNNLVLNKNKQIDSLGFQSLNFVFNEKLNQNLEKYKVIINLKKDEQILDNIELNYEKLEAEFEYKDGVIFEKDFVGCFDDNICSKEEREIGDCYDCYLEDNKKDEVILENSSNINLNDGYQNKNLIIIIVWIIVLIIIGISLFLWWRKKDENHY